MAVNTLPDSDTPPQLNIEGAGLDSLVAYPPMIGQARLLSAEDEEIWIRRGHSLARACSEIAPHMRAHAKDMANAWGESVRGQAFDAAAYSSDQRREEAFESNLELLASARQRVREADAKLEAANDAINEIVPAGEVATAPAFLFFGVMGLVSGLSFVPSVSPIFDAGFAAISSPEVATGLSLLLALGLGMLMPLAGALGSIFRASPPKILGFAVVEGLVLCLFAYARRDLFSLGGAAGFVSSAAATLAAQHGIAITLMLLAIECLVLVACTATSLAMSSALSASLEYARRELAREHANDGRARQLADVVAIEAQIGEHAQFLAKRDEAAALGNKHRDLVLALVMQGLLEQTQANADLLTGTPRAVVEKGERKAG